MSDRTTLNKVTNHVVQLGRAVRLVWMSAPGWTAAQIALVVSQGLVPLATLYIMKHLVDAVSLGQSASGASLQPVLVWILLAFGMAVFSAVLRSLGEVVGKAQAIQVTDAVSDILHAQSVAVDLSYYEDPGYYDTLHRAQQEAPYRPTHILNGLVQVVQNGISLLGIIGLLFWFNWIVGLVLLCAAVPGMLVRLIYGRKLYSFEQKQTETERWASYFHWLLVDSNFAKEIRIFNLGSFFRERFGKLRLDLRKGRLELSSRRAWADTAVQLLAAAAIFGTVALAALQAVRGVITVGSLVAIYMGFQSGLGFLQSLLHGLAGLYEDSLFLTSYYQFLNLQPAIQPPSHPKPIPASIREGICFQDVSFTYPRSTQPALDSIRLCLKPGEVIALVGENGSGKTTLIKLLCNLYHPGRGQITVDGINLNEFDPVCWRREISVIFQDFAHYYLKAWENIWLADIGQEANRERIIAKARLTGADEVISHLPDGYDTFMGSWFAQGHELSAGEWQKIALTRAFWKDGRIIVLDEPTSSLDPLAEAEFFRHFRNLLGGRSAVLISHRLSTVQMADCIYVFDRGKIVERGSHTELLQRDGWYARLFLAQAEKYREKAAGAQPVPGSIEES